ncbi:tRNA 2-thiouridine(34) synthase MnmA [bacterium]|nr:tRNA 2-thiouridine(34) synthase MnmA [bacterium]
MPVPRVLVAMSGGVDSSVAALLLQRQGHEVIGLTANLFDGASLSGPCCGKAGVSMAASVCAQLGIEHHEVDLSALFEQQVIGRFLDGYSAGRTPNPCSDCNRFIKFDAFFEHAERLGCELLATGHYARIVGAHGCAPVPLVGPAEMRADQQGRISAAPTYLATGLDPNKDQSYFLACIPPERLARLRFPIGELTKPEVRELAQEAGLATAQRKESQDICFMANGVKVGHLLEWYRGKAPQPGRIIGPGGSDLGEHSGVENYTIGQRRGLRLGGGTEGLAVQQLDVATNTVLVADPADYQVRALRLKDFVDMAPGRWSPATSVLMCRGRYRQQLWPARLFYCEGSVMVIPEEPLSHMAPGQWCVAYDGDVVLWGGIIDSIEYSSP